MGETGQKQMSEMHIKDNCFDMRTMLEDLKKRTKALMGHSVFNQEAQLGEDRGEMKANIMLTYRHLEDARMRLGKVVQAYDGGKSVYPK